MRQKLITGSTTLLDADARSFAVANLVTGCAACIVGPPQYAPSPCKWWHEQPVIAFSINVSVIDQSCIWHLRPCKNTSCAAQNVPSAIKRVAARPLNEVAGHPSTGLASYTIFRLLSPSVLDLGSGTWQSDRRTTRRQPSMHNAPSLWRA